MDAKSVKVIKQDYLFGDVGDAILKVLCYGASWFGGVLVSKAQGTLSTNQGVFFLFFFISWYRIYFASYSGKRK